MKSFKQFLRENDVAKLPFLDDVIIVLGDGSVELYEGRKWVSGRFDKNIGIDQPTHGAGQEHAHVYGRKNNQIVVVNIDGTSSHNTKGRLHDKDADALRGRGYTIKADNIVEWTLLADQPQLLLG